MWLRLTPLGILWCAALAGWLLTGVMAPTDAAADRVWVGLLPSPWWLAAGLALATAVGLVARPTLQRVLPLALTALFVLPWLPLPVPPALLAFVGPAGFVAIAAIVLLWTAGCLPALRRVPALAHDPRRAAVAAGAMAAVIFGLSAWRAWPMLPGGDEPHYMVTTQSLLQDGDLKVENNYQQRDYRQFIAIDLEPNYWRRGQDGEIYSIHLPGVSTLVLPAFAIGGHPGAVTFLVLLAAGGMALVWRVAWEATRGAAAAWFAWAAATLSAPVLFQAFTVGPDGPAGVLVVVGAWALLRASRRVERSQAQRDRAQGLRDGDPARRERVEQNEAQRDQAQRNRAQGLRDGGPARRERVEQNEAQRDRTQRDQAQGSIATRGAELAGWLAPGAALALLPWLHPRLSVLAGVLGVLVVWQLARRAAGMRRAAAFLAVPVASAAAWFGYFYWIYGDPRPDAAYRGGNLNEIANMPSGLGGLLFDHQFGVIPNAPIFLICFVGLGVMLWGRGERRRESVWLAAGVGALIAIYLLVITPMRMWWAGWSAPARFAAPFLPALAVAAAPAWQAARLHVTHTVMLVALAASAGITSLLVIVERGRLAYNVRDGWSLLFEWLSPVVALPRGMPSFHRLPEHHGFYHAAIWIACVLLAWLLLRRLELARSRKRHRLMELVGTPDGEGPMSRAALATVVPLALGAAAMLAVSAVWMSTGATAVRAAPAQLRVLRRVDLDKGDLAMRFASPWRVAPAEVPGMLRVRASERWLAGHTPPLLALPGGIPAGEYRLHVSAGPSNGGPILACVGLECYPIGAGNLPAAGGELVLPIDLMVDVRAIVVRGGAGAAAAIRDLFVEPVAVRPDRRRGGRQAQQVVRYRGGTTYFLDEQALVDGRGFWVRCGGAADVVIVPRRPRTRPQLTLTNASVANRVELASGDWRLRLDLAPHQTRRVAVPMHPSGLPSAITISASTGVRRMDMYPASRDTRCVGVRVTLR